MGISRRPKLKFLPAEPKGPNSAARGNFPRSRDEWNRERVKHGKPKERGKQKASPCCFGSWYPPFCVAREMEKPKGSQSSHRERRTDPKPKSVARSGRFFEQSPNLRTKQTFNLGCSTWLYIYIYVYMHARHGDWCKIFQV